MQTCKNKAFAALALACAALAPLGSARAAAPDEAYQASSGGLVVMPLSTTDPKSVMDNWGKEGDGVQVVEARSMHRNQPIATFVLFSGCRANADGNCNLTADFETLAPNGSVYDRLAGVKVWVDRPAPPPKAIGLSEGGLGLRIEDKDQLGAYTIRVTVTDHVSGVKLQINKTLTAVD